MSEQRQKAFENLIDAYTALIDRLEAITHEVCTAAERPDLYEKILRANSDLVTAALHIRETRCQNAEFDRYMRQCAERTKVAR